MIGGMEWSGLLAASAMLWVAAAAAAPDGGSPPDPEVKAQDMPPVQAPADPDAVGLMMTQMKRAADELIGQAKKELAQKPHRAVQTFILYEGRIHQVMLPRFGPANAWLYNERSGKVAELYRSLGLDKKSTVSFESYAGVLIEALKSDNDLVLLCDGEAGLLLSLRTGEGLESTLGPLRAGQIMAAPQVQDILGWSGVQLAAGAKAQMDSAKSLVVIEGVVDKKRTLVFVFQEYSTRWVLVEIKSRA